MSLSYAARPSPHATAPAFAQRGPSGRFPRFIARTQALRLLDTLGSASSPSLGCTARLLRRWRGLPGSWGTLPCMPCSCPTPAGPLRQAIRALPYSSARRWCLPPFHTASAPTIAISGLHHTACTLAVYASRSRFPVASVRPRKTRFRLVAHLGRAGFEPAGFLREVSALSRRFLLAQASPGARGICAELFAPHPS